MEKIRLMNELLTSKYEHTYKLAVECYEDILPVMKALQNLKITKVEISFKHIYIYNSTLTFSSHLPPQKIWRVLKSLEDCHTAARTFSLADDFDSRWEWPYNSLSFREWKVKEANIFLNFKEEREQLY
jgi:hypothetical protein